VRITDVVLRDGLQSLDRFVPTDRKLRIVDALVRAGFTSIEVTSFVRPDVVPNLADADELFRRLQRAPGVRYRALVANLEGVYRAVAAGADELVAVVTLGEGYALRNQNRSVDEVLRSATQVLEAARDAGKPVEVALAMAFVDPYAGDTPFARVEAAVERLLDAGAESFQLATSTGVESPTEVRDAIARLREGRPELDLGVHLHNTNGMALVTAYLALEAGVRRFETSLCGIGGGIALPAGPADTGNLATEDLVHFLSTLGVDTGLDVHAVIECAREVAAIIGIEPRSHAAAGGTKAQLLRRGAG
jgi:hydroxymethylglutaryl-CoA lyase